MLAKRLVHHMSASDDAEASMISKLKQACGFEYTSKLQRMFQDIGVSKDLNERFKRHLTNSAEPLDMDFSIQVCWFSPNRNFNILNINSLIFAVCLGAVVRFLAISTIWQFFSAF